MKSIKRVLSAALTLAMVISMISVNAFAAFTEYQGDGHNAGWVSSAPIEGDGSKVLNINNLGLSPLGYNCFDSEPLIKDGVAYLVGAVEANGQNQARLFRVNLNEGSSSFLDNGIVLESTAASFQTGTPVIDGNILYAAINKTYYPISNYDFSAPMGAWYWVNEGTAGGCSNDYQIGDAKLYNFSAMWPSKVGLAQRFTTAGGCMQLNYYYKVTGNQGHVTMSARMREVDTTQWTTLYSESVVSSEYGHYITLDVSDYFAAESTEYEIEFLASVPAENSSTVVDFYNCGINRYQSNIVKVSNITAETPNVTVLTTTRDEQLNSPLKIYNGDIYTGAYRLEAHDGAYYQVDPSTGEITEFGDIEPGDSFYNTGALDVNGNQIIFGSEQGNIYVYSYADISAPLAVLNLSDESQVNAGSIRSSISIDKNPSGVSYNLHCTSTGGYLWSLSYYWPRAEISLQGEITAVRSTSTPVADNTYAYIGGNDGVLRCYNSDDNTEVWSYQAAGDYPSISGSPLVYTAPDGTSYVYFTTNCAEGAGYCVKYSGTGTQGEQVWKVDSTSNNRYSLQGFAISDGYAVFANDGGDIVLVWDK